MPCAKSRLAMLVHACLAVGGGARDTAGDDLRVMDVRMLDAGVRGFE